MSTYLFRLAQWAFRRRRLVLTIWVVAAVAMLVAAGASGGKTNDVFTIPGTESQQASDLLTKKIPALGGGQTQVVFATSGAVKVTDPGPKAGIEQSMANLAKIPQVGTVVDPYQAGLVSKDGYAALGQVQFPEQPANIHDSTLDAMEAAVAPAKAAGVQVEYTGSVYPGWRVVPSEIPEIVGVIVAFIILLVTFGALVAAGLPILAAVLGVVLTLSGVTALAAVVNIASASTTVALMLGLSCGIDYSLFILSRHRTHLLNGMDIERSVGIAAGTAGGSVVFAGLTVIIALCGLSVVGIPFLTIMGLAAAAAVLVAVLIALTLLPAVLGFAGAKVTKFVNPPGLRGRAERSAVKAASEPQSTAGAAWARFTTRYRVPVLIGGVGLLVLFALPALDVELGLPSGSSLPTSNTSRRAYDLTAEHFGPGFNGPLLVVADGVTSPQTASQMAATLAKIPQVESATPAAVQNGVAVIRVVPTTGPSDPATATLVHGLRDNRAEIEGNSGATVLIGGTTASNIDVSAKLSSALPTFLAVVVGLAFVLLTFAFRTILVPIKSIIGFLLSVSAALGLSVAVFQWGWGEKIFGITKAETISFLPIIMLAIIFGLSSDYEVFVVSRIKEDFTKNGDARRAVVRGTGLAARVVTAAALIMFSIFVAFMITKDPTIKAIGFTFAAGVFLDAFVVRLTLVPAVMAIAGARIWYHPRWFEKHVPDPDIEGHRLEQQLAQDKVG